MKKKIILLGMVCLLGASTVVGCSGDKESKNKAKTETTDKSDKKKDSKELELSTYQQALDALCESKVNNDMDTFLQLFDDYMQGMMKAAVKQDDTFAAISKKYKEACGDKITWNYEITGAIEMGKEDIASYQQSLDMFGEEKTITEGYHVTAKVHLKGDKGTKDYDLDVSLGNVGGKWHVIDFGDGLLE